MKISCAACCVGLLLIGWTTGIVRAGMPRTDEQSNTKEEKTLPPRQAEARPAAPATAECEDSWSLVASLNWGGVADWDLHLETPNAHIYWNNRQADGFTLDKDAQPICSPTPPPPETITGNGQCGTYKVYTDLYRTCTGTPQPTFSATVTAIRPIRINGTTYNPGQTFNAEDNVPFVVASACVTSLEVTGLHQFDSPWGGDIYDSTSEHISKLGCALTSVTMGMNFVGLSSVTPRTLNQSLNAAPGGYAGGGVNWPKIPRMGNVVFKESIPKRNSVSSPQAAKDYLDYVLCELERPVVVGVFNHPVAPGAACPLDEWGHLKACHFVLVTGKQSDGKYTIADPGTAIGHTTLDAYGNRFETRGYVTDTGQRTSRRSPGVSASLAIEQLSVSAGGPVSLLVLDPIGNRTGIDPISGEQTEAIPNSAHFVDSLSDDETGEDGVVAAQSVYVEPPSAGRYEIRVTPSQDGPFSLLATALSADGSEATLLSINGIGVRGQTQVYYVTIGSSSNLGNISTRLRVETGSNVLIGGFIVTGTQPKPVIVRAIGPSLPLAGALSDPVLEIRNSSGGLVALNDDWRTDQQAQIIATGIPPSNNLESAIVATLPANGSAYTAIVRGYNNATGIGVVEAYDLDRTANSRLVNISTRGFVSTGDNVMIGGTIILGSDPANILIRAIGPSLTNFGVPNALQDPTLELHDGNGGLLLANDNWRSTQEAEIIATGIPPSNDLESAILVNLPPGNYTAIVRGVNSTTGVALVEAYQLQ